MEDEIDKGPDRLDRKRTRRRESAATDRLGAALVALPEEQLAQIPLSEAIADAVRMAHRISSHGAHRRQLQLIEKLMRSADPEPIQAALDKVGRNAAIATAAHHQSEHWRDRLIAEGDPAAAEFLLAHPNTDRQQLRQLVRAAQHERAANKPPKSSRELFRLVREVLEAG